MTIGTTAIASYAEQSSITDPGIHAHRLDAIPAEPGAVKNAANRLVFHYRAGGDWVENGIARERICEIDTRYADLMLDRLVELKDAPLATPRLPHERLVGCCRDFTVLFLAIARHKGIPARMRVGFATYFVPGWYIDHVVAEVWDETEARWRLVDAELVDGHVDRADDTVLDPLDLPQERFITGPLAWEACRRQEMDPERFVVAPEIDIPHTRGWPFLMHNLVHDLAALNMREMLLWEEWGLQLHEEPMMPDHLDLLDRVAAITKSSQSTPQELRELYDRDEFRVPVSVQSFTPAVPAIPFPVELPR